MSVWHHLFVDDLEYAPAAHILSGLSMEHALARPKAELHSIYEELFHAAHWQQVMVGMAKGASKNHPDAEWPPESAPLDARAWSELVVQFLAGSEEAVALGEQTERHGEVLEDGRTVRERLELLAVHNAYHMGKIVLLRQLLGVWSPPPDDA